MQTKDAFFAGAGIGGGAVGARGLAALWGAAHIHGHPALDFNEDAATPYFALDGTGRLLSLGLEQLTRWRACPCHRC